MPQVTIENPILNSAFEAPRRHFRFDNDGITTEVDDKRRASAFFMPIARARRKGEQAHFDTEWTADRIQPNSEINRIRERVDRWRDGGYVDVTPLTRRLLEYWADPAREETSARGKRSRRPSTPPKWPRATATRGLTTTCATGTWNTTRACRAWHSRWRPAAARPSSWRCSSRGRRSTQAREPPGRPLLGRVSRRDPRYHDP